MHFNETIQAINAIHILDSNFKKLLDQCNVVKTELFQLRNQIAQLRNENEQLKKELNDKRKRDPEEVARNESRTNNGSTATTT